jgi:hypothetical protein
MHDGMMGSVKKEEVPVKEQQKAEGLNGLNVY